MGIRYQESKMQWTYLMTRDLRCLASTLWNDFQFCVKPHWLVWLWYIVAIGYCYNYNVIWVQSLHAQHPVVTKAMPPDNPQREVWWFSMPRWPSLLFLRHCISRYPLPSTLGPIWQRSHPLCACGKQDGPPVLGLKLIQHIFFKFGLVPSLNFTLSKIRVSLMRGLGHGA